MRVLLVNWQTEGGICHYTYCLADALSEFGDRPTVLTRSNTPYELEFMPHHHMVIKKLHVAIMVKKSERISSFFNNIQSILKETTHYDIVHFQCPIGPRTDHWIWKSIRLLKRPVIYTVHDAVPHESYNPMEQHTGELARQADIVITHGERLKETLIQVHKVPSGKIRIVPLGNYIFIENLFHQWNRQNARESFDLSDQEQCLLFFGYVRPYKGLDTLIEACRIIKERRPDIGPRMRLLIGGTDPWNYWESGNYEKQIEESGLTNQTKRLIEYIPLDDIGRYFHAADVVALPYKWGSQSAVLQLAYAFSKPAVVTDVGSISEAVQNGVTGLVVPPSDPQSLADALIQLLSDPARAEEIGKAGRRYAETELSWRKIAEQTHHIYTGLLR